jgi:hypothetical protein
MLKEAERWELDVIPPLDAVTITLNLSPTDLELAVATSGLSLGPAMMRAIVAHGGRRDHPGGAALILLLSL